LGTFYIPSDLGSSGRLPCCRLRAPPYRCALCLYIGAPLIGAALGVLAYQFIRGEKRRRPVGLDHVGDAALRQFQDWPPATARARRPPRATTDLINSQPVTRQGDTLSLRHRIGEVPSAPAFGNENA